MNTFFKILLMLILFCIFANGGDLDDGISTYTEDSINKYDQVFKKGVNISYVKAISNAGKNKRAQNKKHDSSKDTNTTDKDGIIKDNKGNMYITNKSKLKSGKTIINRSTGGKDMQGNMYIDKSVRIPVGARVINAPKFK